MFIFGLKIVNLFSFQHLQIMYEMELTQFQVKTLHVIGLVVYNRDSRSKTNDPVILPSIVLRSDRQHRKREPTMTLEEGEILDDTEFIDPSEISKGTKIRARSISDTIQIKTLFKYRETFKKRTRIYMKTIARDRKTVEIMKNGRLSDGEQMRQQARKRYVQTLKYLWSVLRVLQAGK